MSRLDSFIRRLEAQRRCLNWAAIQIKDLPGPIFELGLGNGRTWHHMRMLMPDRRILVFERNPAPHEDCRPDDKDLVIGDLTTTLAGQAGLWAGKVALIHSDIGTGDASRNARLAKLLNEMLPPLLGSGAIILSDQPLELGEQPGFIDRRGDVAIDSRRYDVWQKCS